MHPAQNIPYLINNSLCLLFQRTYNQSHTISFSHPSLCFNNSGSTMLTSFLCTFSLQQVLHLHHEWLSWMAYWYTLAFPQSVMVTTSEEKTLTAKKTCSSASLVQTTLSWTQFWHPVSSGYCMKLTFQSVSELAKYTDAEQQLTSGSPPSETLYFHAVSQFSICSMYLIITSVPNTFWQIIPFHTSSLLDIICHFYVDQQLQFHKHRILQYC